MLKPFILGLLAFSVVLNAETASAPKVAPTIHKLPIAKVAKTASVVQENRQHPYTEFVIAIPVQIQPEDACIKFAGQVNSGEPKNYPLISTVGARSPLAQACISVVPQPIEVALTYRMKVLTGGFVAPERFQRITVQFDGPGLFEIELDLNDSSVSVKPVGRRPR